MIQKEAFLVTMYKTDEKKERAEGDASSEHSLQQQCRPAAQHEDMHKQPTEEKNGYTACRDLVKGRGC